MQITDAMILVSAILLSCIIAIQSQDVPIGRQSATTPLAPTTNFFPSPATTAKILDDANVENGNIFGCRWPADFTQRYKFCVDKAGLEKIGQLPGDVESGEQQIQYGLLDRGIIDQLLNSCNNENMYACVRTVDNKAIESFVDRWEESLANFTEFENCLQSNTEAMNRLCGTDTQVSKIVSGAAGLHLNVVNVLIKTHTDTLSSNVTRNCRTSIAQAVHVTAALYIKSKQYQQNSVLCWNAGRNECSNLCQAYAAELNCLQAECTDMKLNLLQQLGIWQWYFLDPATVRDKCHIKDDKCTVTDTGPSGSLAQLSSWSSLFNSDSLQQKFGEVKTQLESRFHMPFARIAAIILGAIAAFCGLCIFICAYYYGVWGRRRKNTRYSRLLDERIGGAMDAEQEAKSLTHQLDEDFDD